MSVKSRGKQAFKERTVPHSRGKKKKSKKSISKAAIKSISTKDNIKLSLKKSKKFKKSSDVSKPSRKCSKAKRFGSVSSDSEPEPIAVESWGFADDTSTSSTDDDAHGLPRDMKGLYKSRSAVDDVALSSDLEDSETDEDEPPVDLDSLQQSSISCTNDDASENSSSSPRDDPPLKISESLTKPVTSTSAEAGDSTYPTSINFKSSETTSSSGWKSENDMLKVIELRAVDLSSRSLYVTPIPPDCSIEGLKKLSPTAISARLACNSHSHLCRRYAFLEYADCEAASAARKAIMGRLFGGKPVNVQPVRPQYIMSMRGDCIDRKQLYVTGLHPSVTKSDLNQLFPKANEIDYPHHCSGYPLGYATVKFVNDEVALEAFQYAHKRVIKGQAVSVNYVISSHNARTQQQNCNPEVGKSIQDATPVHSGSFPSLGEKEPPPSIAPTTTSRNVTAKPKVLIKPIGDVDLEEKEEKERRDRTKTESNEPFLKPHGGTNIIAKLLHLHRQTETENPMNGGSDSGEEDTNSESDGSTHDNPESNPDTDGTNESQDHSEDDGEENQDGTTSSEESASSESFKFSTPGNQDTPCEKSPGSSGEEIDHVLETVMRARRGAARALKNAGSVKRKRSLAASAKPFDKGTKPQKRPIGAFTKMMLAVPSKKKRAR